MPKTAHQKAAMNTHSHRRPHRIHRHRKAPMTTIRPAGAALAAVLAALAVTGCQPAAAHADTTTASSSTAGDTRHARAQLDTLTVRTEDTGAHYRRADWGGWTRPAGTGGCDTRARVLLRDASPGSGRRGSGCRVTAGAWVSSYDRTRITDPRDVQIDHRVPVREAQRSGARGWTPAQRARFYNDPANLIAVSAHANTSKGDDDPGRWRPPNRASWCGYASAYVTTKHAYRLTVDPAERAGLVAMLNTCPGGAR